MAMAAGGRAIDQWKKRDRTRQQNRSFWYDFLKIKECGPLGRSAAGVRGIGLDKRRQGDYVVGMICIDPGRSRRLDTGLYRKGGNRRSAPDWMTIAWQTVPGRCQEPSVTDKTRYAGLRSNWCIVRMTLMSYDNQWRYHQDTFGWPARNGTCDTGVRLIRLDERDEIGDVAVVTRDDEEVGLSRL